MNIVKGKKTAELHCLNVIKIYDWITKQTQIKLKEAFFKKEKVISQKICCEFRVPCNVSEKTVVWTGFGIEMLTGTFTIKLCNGNDCRMKIYINGEKAAIIQVGQSFSSTVRNLNKIEVLCEGEAASIKQECYGQLKLTPLFLLEECFEIDKIECFLSDCEGNPATFNNKEAIFCEEISDPDNRKVITLKRDNVVLQEVVLLKKGFVTVELHHKNKLSTSCTFQFSEVETVFLCAPKGTFIHCEITDFSCRAYLIPSHNKTRLEFALIIDVCQSIQSEGNVKIELSGKVCNEREDIEATVLCPEFKLPENCFKKDN